MRNYFVGNVVAILVVAASILTENAPFGTFLAMPPPDPEGDGFWKPYAGFTGVRKRNKQERRPNDRFLEDPERGRNQFNHRGIHPYDAFPAMPLAVYGPYNSDASFLGPEGGRNRFDQPYINRDGGFPGNPLAVYPDNPQAVYTASYSGVIFPDPLNNEVTSNLTVKGVNCRKGEKLGDCCPPKPCEPSCKHPNVLRTAENAQWKRKARKCIQKCVCEKGLVRRPSDLKCIPSRECPNKNRPKFLSIEGWKKKYPTQECSRFSHAFLLPAILPPNGNFQPSPILPPPEDI